jgi:tight adherence protein C
VNTFFAVPALSAAVVLALGVVFVLGLRMMRADATDRLAVEDLVLLRPEQRREAGQLPPLERLALRFVPTLRGLLGRTVTAQLQKRIDEAGRPDGLTVDIFLRRVIVWFLIFLAPVLLFLALGDLLFALVALLPPLFLPIGRLAAAQRKRSDIIDRDLPDFLDVLAVTVTAGVAFRPALTRVSERFRGPLAEEILLTLGQMANGASTRAAFQNLRSRAPSESMAQFVTALLQSEELGAPLADTLNQIALDMRRSSAQRMRRQAARAAPRVTLVTSIVIVPGVLATVLVGFLIGSGVTVGSLFGG